MVPAGERRAGEVRVVDVGDQEVVLPAVVAGLAAGPEVLHHREHHPHAAQVLVLSLENIRKEVVDSVRDHKSDIVIVSRQQFVHKELEQTFTQCR